MYINYIYEIYIYLYIFLFRKEQTGATASPDGGGCPLGHPRFYSTLSVGEKHT